MRAIRVASLALIGTAALTLGAPVAFAEDETNITSFGFTVTPETVAPGGTVTLNATECASPTVLVSSGIFDTVTLAEGHSATAKVDDAAKPEAEYDITFDCKGEKGSIPLTVTGGSGTDTGTGTETGKETGTGAGAETETGIETETETETGTGTETGTETGMVKPGGGVRAGAGGSFSDLSPVQIGVGSALLAGAAGGSVLLLLRRSGDSV
ncbi:hypothetical protein HRW12_11965 [Streptomyces lunaelactis]|uniref:hypothetical protein n=1 Tax=Streptomyces lunaelactis TaxID=1535768 RepID=UPI0015850A27|nr:hypothetical protein [Streptomyces lunaelactis]NUK34467.1 hypothetical protein [Streptomyces lunaelactis]NUK39413.1 hypothetical protein [Streptomyces lunaelactis]